MKLKNLFISLLVSTAVFISCDEVEEKNELKDTVTIDATSYSDWVYFSFEDSIVTVDDPMTSDAWDIAFKRMDFKTNSGKSGSANGGAYKSNSTDLDVEFTIEDNVFVADDSITVFVFGMGRPTVLLEAGSSELSGVKDEDANYTSEGAWSVSGEMQNRRYSANDEIFFIKCADGEYAKVQFISYYDLTGEVEGTGSGYITFEYRK